VNHEKVARRIVSRAIVTGLGIACLSGCASAEKEPSNDPPVTAVTPNRQQPSIEVICSPDTPDRWSVTPSNVSSEKIASILRVRINDIAQGGRFGPATCEQPVSVDRIGSDEPPIVAVTGEGQPCAVIDTQQELPPNTTTTEVVAICANPN
jgi:hypothetical protein